MLEKLPAFYYPTSVVILDDDTTLLSALKMALGDIYKVITFNRTEDFYNFFKNYESFLSKKKFLQSDFKDEFFGSADKTAINFDIKMISNISKEKERLDEISIFVIDHQLSDDNGFNVAKNINHHQIFKVMLTGTASDNAAITGLNDKTINLFMKKGEKDLFEKLEIKLKALSLEFFVKKTELLISLLETESQLPITDSAFIDFFLDTCEKNSIEEFYLIDKNGSFLCVDEKKNKYYLIVYSDDSLDAWLDTYAGDGLSKTLQDKVENREIIPFFGINSEATQFDINEWTDHFYPANYFSGSRKKYYWAFIKDEAS